MFFETLENRALFSVSLSAGVLTVTGTNLNDTIVVNKNGAGQLTVNDDGALHTYGWTSVNQVNVNALAGDDTVTSFNNMNKKMVVHGGDGNDVIRTGAGNDELYGDNGNDLLDGRQGDDNTFGGAGNDTADYSDRTNNLTITLDDINNDGGPGGHDNIHSDIENVDGGSGNDYIVGSAASNYIVGGAGNDSCFGGAGGSDVLVGGIGNDYLSLGSGNGTAEGDDGNDTVIGGYGLGKNYLYGNAGADSILGEGAQNSMDGGDGNDYLNSYGSDTSWEYGQAGDDVIWGGYGQNVIYGGIGNDQLHGWSANTNWVYGEAGNDVIWGGTGANVLDGGDGNDEVHGSGTGTNWLYGGNGDDKIYSTATGTTNEWGGAGNDFMYAGRGYSWMSGDDGDDTLVSIGGSHYDVVYGGNGLDSFWVDAEYTEQTPDLNFIEALVGTSHRVGSFYGGVSRERVGQNLTDPNIYDAGGNGGAGYSPDSRNFSDKPLFASTGPGENDISQGQVGDCYFLAGLSGTAKMNPLRIKQSVVELGDGTYAVQFKSGGTTTFVRVDGDLPTYNGSTYLYYAKQGAEGDIWVPVMEKAFAFWRRSQNSYASISGGSIDEPFNALGGSSVASVWGSSAGVTLNNINAALGAGKQVSAWTPNVNATNGCPCVGNHAYTVDHVNYQSFYLPYIGWINVPVSITLRNPWGYDGAGSDSNTSDGYVTATADQFFNYFGGADAAYV